MAFRFPSHGITDADPEFQRFLSSGQTTVHNPWPELADPTDFGMAWSQPLLRMLYLPASFSFLTSHLEGHHGSSLVWDLVFAHEIWHQRLDCTPAKEAARLNLVSGHEILAYHVNQSSGRRRFRKEEWEPLERVNQNLSDACRLLELTEELLVTAFSFAEIAARLPPSSLSVSYAMERTWVGFQARALGPAFRQWYPLVRSLAFRFSNYGTTTPSVKVFKLLGTYLQSIFVSGDTVIIMPPEERLLYLDTSLAYLKDEHQVLRWLQEQADFSDQDKVLATLLALQVRMTERLLTARDIWDALGRRMMSSVDRLPITQERTSNNRPLAQIVRSTRLTLLAPVESQGRWYVKAVSSGMRRQRPLFAVVLDSLRQQLSAKRGFHCPAKLSAWPDECVCRDSFPQLRTMLSQLYRWGEDGRFGHGNWASPGPPCSDA